VRGNWTLKAAAEMRDLVTGLEVRELVTKVDGVRVWAEAGPEFADALKGALGVRARIEPKPAPVLLRMSVIFFRQKWRAAAGNGRPAGNGRS